MEMIKKHFGMTARALGHLTDIRTFEAELA